VPLKKGKTKKKRRSKIADQSWEGVDEGLFEGIRALRKEIADGKGVPAFVVFGDASLRDMARKRPSCGQRFMEIHGVGHKKRKDYGETFVEAISSYCKENKLEMDIF
jgi:ATP-dependent DNA helicase RecQ